MSESFSYKFVAEIKPLVFDFTEVLAPTETLVTATCTVLVLNGTDSSPSSILSGSASISGTLVTQKVQAGTANVTYRLVMTVTTSASSTLIAIGDLPVYNTSTVQ
jgi:bifunctional N-acetylglucosamine-1-phosphate-uridyltransferase/glucosamine-1-phosphate-acetyltransferase GlmU-like protein